MAEEENKSSTLPPYPEMILAAITALGNDEGSSKSAISEYIESQYEDLPAGHSTLLTHHLNKMKDGGELVLKNNNYAKPDTTATPMKRGRGRPPKPKDAGSAPPSTPRPRGRPPKPKDPLAVASAKASSGMPKRRGRPPKQGGTPAKAAKAAKPAKPKTTTKKAAAASPAVGQKRGRGRPPKVKPEVAVN